MENFTPIASLSGGILIGLATAAVLLFNGRIAGISGIAGGILRLSESDRDWRAVFVIGLLIGGVIAFGIDPSLFSGEVERPAWLLVLAGVLVGIGTQMGNGCTSGHGICGLSRVSARSLVAVLTFLGTAAATVAAMTLLGGTQ